MLPAPLFVKTWTLFLTSHTREGANGSNPGKALATFGVCGSGGAHVPQLASTSARLVLVPAACVRVQLYTERFASGSIKSGDIGPLEIRGLVVRVACEPASAVANPNRYEHVLPSGCGGICAAQTGTRATGAF